jgi:CBS domain-containing protein
VADFVGADRALKALALHTLAELDLGPPSDGVRASGATTLRDALSLMLAEQAEVLAVTDDHGRVLGSVSKDDLLR